MREFACTTVKEAKTVWEGLHVHYPDSLPVRLFLEEVQGQTTVTYHAMIQVPCDDGGSGLSEPINYGHPSDVPKDWLDASNIRFFFGVSIEEFCAPGFWESFLAGD